MCGISGLFDLSDTSSEQILAEMSGTLSHRGPDGEGSLFIAKDGVRVGIAHKRLSIIDLSDLGAQPMSIESLHLTFNGEVYNHSEIRTELEALGHHFKSRTDSEVVLHAYKQWGADCLHRFRGMFAFTVFDSAEMSFFCARDRAGVKPFFYFFDGKTFLFASELKAFHKHPSFAKKISDEGVTAFFQFGNIPAPYTIFENCFKLPPAHFLKFGLKSKVPVVTRYWSVYDHYNRPKTTLGFAEAKKKTEEVLREAFNYRLVSDVPLGVFLSGGYDSTCLTSVLQKDRREKINTFTIGFENSPLNEAPFAKQIARHIGTHHSEYYCKEQDALDLIPGLPYFFDEPFGDQSAIPTTLVSQIARGNVTVALSADAGDEVFAGYNRYDYLMKHGKMISSAPEFLRKGLSKMLSNIPSDKIPFARKTYNFHHRYEKLKTLVNDPSPENWMMSLSVLFSNDQLTKLLKKGPKPVDTAYRSKQLKKEYFTPLAFMMAVDYETYLPDDILQKVDRSSMSRSLEAREPFLDHKVIEWAAQLPDHFKYHKGIKKFILRELVHDHVPKELMDRPKMGFAIPLDKWLLTSLKPLVTRYLGSVTPSQEQFFNKDSVTELMNDFYNGKTENAQKIWYLLMFLMWMEKWDC